MKKGALKVLSPPIRLCKNWTILVPHQRVLILEPSRELADKSRNLLERERYEVEIVLNLKSAENIIRERRMSLIIVDLDLEEISGVEAVKRIRRLDKTVPIIAIHSQDSEEVSEALYLIENISYLKKPVEFEDIFERIKEILPR